MSYGRMATGKGNRWLPMRRWAIRLLLLVIGTLPTGLAWAHCFDGARVAAFHNYGTGATIKIHFTNVEQTEQRFQLATAMSSLGNNWGQVSIRKRWYAGDFDYMDEWQINDGVHALDEAPIAVYGNPNLVQDLPGAYRACFSNPATGEWTFGARGHSSQPIVSSGWAGKEPAKWEVFGETYGDTAMPGNPVYKTHFSGLQYKDIATGSWTTMAIPVDVKLITTRESGSENPYYFPLMKNELSTDRKSFNIWTSC
jgi:hypothetical protein